MPKIFLSPSTQGYNEYVIGNSERYYMNLLADAMEPYLTASGIQFSRNDPNLDVSNSVAQSNDGNYDLHIALHSNASGSDYNPGENQGTQIYYFLGSTEGQKIANLLAEQFRQIYPYPQLVTPIPTRSLYELRNTRAPAALIEVAFHDNYQDALWIANNMDTIARAIVMAICEYLGIPFVEASIQRSGTIAAGFNINLRDAPNYGANILTVIPNGAAVTVETIGGDWYRINYNGQSGYVEGRFVILNP